MSDEKGPERIRAWGHSGDSAPIRGFVCPGERRYDECGGVEFTRTDLAALPDDLREDLRTELETQAGEGRGTTHWEGCERSHPWCRVNQLLRRLARHHGVEQ